MRLLGPAAGRVRIGRMPWHLLAAALVLSAIGAAFIWSAHSAALAKKHSLFTAIGCAAFLLVALFDYRHFRSLALPLYAVGLLAVAALFPFGITVNYSRRWFDLGVLTVQPSEPMRYLLVIALADYFRLRQRRDRLRDLAAPLVLTFIPAALIALEPDFSAAVLLVPVFVATAFLAGVPVRNLALLVLVGCLLLTAAWFTPGVLRDYQRSRVLGFINPAADPQSLSAYNAEQATMAISGGGLAGQGWGQGVLTQLGRIPEQYADFIFPVIAEEWGFVRTAPIVCLYLLVMVFLAQAARGTQDPFGRLLVGGVLTVFALQSFLHMAVSLRLAPVTGLTLPLVSYGGSSLVSTYAGFGLVASVQMHREVEFSAEALRG